MFSSLGLQLYEERLADRLLRELRALAEDEANTSSTLGLA